MLCIRNGIAHWRENGNNNIEFRSSDGGEITSVAIKGSTGRGKNKKYITITYDLTQNGIINFMEKVYGYLK